MFKYVNIYCDQTIEESVESDFDSPRVSLAFTLRPADHPYPELRKKWVLNVDGWLDGWIESDSESSLSVTSHLRCPLCGQCVAQMR